MDYKLTHYIYPIPKSICLSKHFGFHLDNPRTKEEIKDVIHYLTDSRETSLFPLIAKSKNDFSTAESYLLKFRDHFSNIDPYVIEVFKGYKTEKILEYIAKQWLIIRFEDAGLKEHAREYGKKLKQEGKHGFVMPDDEHPAIKNEEALREYCALLSLLIYDNSDESYNGQNILMKELSHTQDDDPWFNFICFFTAAPRYTDKHLDMAQGWDWLFYPSIKDELLNSTKLLEDAFFQGSAEKLLYIGNLLYIAGQDTHDVKVKILLLTSILELLLTHNPDFSRFNVEDSINKQFQLKVTTLLKIHNPNLDLAVTKENLKKIYSARSSVAHGNFAELSKIENSAKKKKDLDEQYPLESIVANLYTYTKGIIKMYLTDKEFVEFLKQG